MKAVGKGEYATHMVCYEVALQIGMIIGHPSDTPRTSLTLTGKP